MAVGLMAAAKDIAASRRVGDVDLSSSVLAFTGFNHEIARGTTRATLHGATAALGVSGSAPRVVRSSRLGHLDIFDRRVSSSQTARNGPFCHRLKRLRMICSVLFLLIALVSALGTGIAVAQEPPSTGATSIQIEPTISDPGIVIAASESGLIGEARAGTASPTYWPPNHGFQGTPITEELSVGMRIDRYGYEGGTFLSPEGTPDSMRSLAPGTTAKPYNVYEVTRPIEVQSGKAAPWFGQIGQGTQYEFPMSVTDAIAKGYLRRVGP